MMWGREEDVTGECWIGVVGGETAGGGAWTEGVEGGDMRRAAWGGIEKEGEAVLGTWVVGVPGSGGELYREIGNGALLVAERAGGVAGVGLVVTGVL
jgi:hypothetical protein